MLVGRLSLRHALISGATATLLLGSDAPLLGMDVANPIGRRLAEQGAIERGNRGFGPASRRTIDAEYERISREPIETSGKSVEFGSPIARTM
jgi:hypothetical protein